MGYLVKRRRKDIMRKNYNKNRHLPRVNNQFSEHKDFTPLLLQELPFDGRTKPGIWETFKVTVKTVHLLAQALTKL